MNKCKENSLIDVSRQKRYGKKSPCFGQLLREHVGHFAMDEIQAKVIDKCINKRKVIDTSERKEIKSDCVFTGISQ